MSGVFRLNALDEASAQAALLRCCGCVRWVRGMLCARPFRDEAHLFAVAEAVWADTGPDDWREAMTHHPRIGEQALRDKFAGTAGWSTQEQQGVAGAGEDVLSQLAQGNREYEEKFGFIFLVCATGKTAAQMLELLRARLPHDRETELQVAAAEQAKITRLRLQKLLTE